MDYIWYTVNSVTRFASRLDENEWMYVLYGVVIFGLFCMRGFGSRKNY